MMSRMTTTTPTEPPDFNRRVVESIRAELARQGINWQELGRRVGHNANWVSRRLSPRIDPSYRQPLALADIEAIADVLGVDPAQLVQAAA